MNEIEPTNHQEGAELEKATEKYKKYFDILRRNDTPIRDIPNLDFLTQGLPTEKMVTQPLGPRGAGLAFWQPIESKAEALKEFQKRIEEEVASWLFLKNLYESIDTEGQDEGTGKSIIEKIKILIARFDSLFIKVTKLASQNPDNLPIDDLEELKGVRDNILKSSMEYGDLPAVRIYEEIGRKGTFGDGIDLRDEWFRAGKPTPTEWFEKWFGEGQKK